MPTGCSSPRAVRREVARRGPKARFSTSASSTPSSGSAASSIGPWMARRRSTAPSRTSACRCRPRTAVAGTCQAPARTLWPPDPEAPDWEDAASRQWMTLLRCWSCRRLWVRVPHAPYASFPYAVLWPYDESESETLYDVDSGTSLRAWHVGAIAEAERTFSPGDRAIVRTHRRRSLGRAPFPEDDPPGAFDLAGFRERILGGGR